MKGKELDYVLVHVLQQILALVLVLNLGFVLLLLEKVFVFLCLVLRMTKRGFRKEEGKSTCSFRPPPWDEKTRIDHDGLYQPYDLTLEWSLLFRA